MENGQGEETSTQHQTHIGGKAALFTPPPAVLRHGLLSSATTWGRPGLLGTELRLLLGDRSWWLYDTRFSSADKWRAKLPSLPACWRWLLLRRVWTRRALRWTGGLCTRWVLCVCDRLFRAITWMFPFPVFLTRCAHVRGAAPAWLPVRLPRHEQCCSGRGAGAIHRSRAGLRQHGLCAGLHTDSGTCFLSLAVSCPIRVRFPLPATPSFG